MQQQGNYNLLINKINLFTRKYYLNNLLRGLIFLGAGIFSAYVVITLSEYFGNFNTLARTLLFYSFILLNLGLVVWLVVPSLMAYLNVGKTLSHNEAAEIIGKHFPGVSDKLLNTLQLKKQADADERSRQLIEASIDQKIALLKPISFPSAVNLKENNKYLKWLILPVAVICIIAFAAPSVLTESTKRLIRHNEYFSPLAPFKFEVLNNNLSAVQGEDVKLQIKLSGDKIPADVYVETANNTFKLDKENLTRFHYVFTNVQQNTTFRLSANGYYSEPYQIKVNLKPSLLHFDVALSYPAYLHKKNETIMNAGDLNVPAGTVVKWQLHTQNTDKVLFGLDNAQKTLVNGVKGLFEHTERITKNGVYSLKPQNGIITRGDSANYRITVIADEAPSITVEQKADSVITKALYFAGRVQDDHGFSNLTFHYRVSGQTERQVSKAVKADLRQTQSDFFYYWDLKQLNIKPGDEVFYYFDIADNDAVAGPKHARSPERTLTVPTEKEWAEQLNAGTKSVMDKMQSAMKMAAQVEREAQKLNQLLLNKNTLSFDEKKQVQDLINKKKELNELVKKMQEENKKNLYNRQESQKQDENLTEKQKQMDELLKNVLDPETEKLMEKLQQMLEQERKDSTREALNQMQNQNRDLKREMNRLQELYKQLQFDQQLDQTAKQLEKLADEQNKLANKTQQPQGGNKQDLQKEQDKLSQDFKQVEKQMDELQKQNEQLDKKNNFQNAAQDKQEVEQQMNDSKEGIQKDQRQNAAKSQRQASQKMKQMAQKMRESNQEGEEKQNEVDAQQLRELLKSLVNSSFEQEKVMQTLRNTNPGDPNYVTLAQKQKDIKDNLKTAQDTLFALSKRIQQIQSTVNTEINSINDHIDKALENLGDRRTAEANRNQQFTMTSMNNLALMLNEALDNLQNQMNKSKGGKGKQQQTMQQLSRQQQQLNQNMQRMREQMQQQGNNMGKSQHQSQSEQLARMARQQQQIRQDLQKLDQQQNKDGRSGMGDLQKIAKQMEQTENDLVNRRITDEALKRQQQIQTRLLEAEKAEQEREQDRQRNSNAGKELPPGYIKALQNYEQVRSKQTEQIKTVPAALNLYYKQKIKTYFDQLNAK